LTEANGGHNATILVVFTTTSLSYTIQESDGVVAIDTTSQTTQSATQQQEDQQTHPMALLVGGFGSIESFENDGHVVNGTRTSQNLAPIWLPHCPA
jgi:hypothetical protein